MTLKIIQLNMWTGRFLDAMIDFLRVEDPDIITLQEVSGGNQNSWSDTTIDTFAALREALQMQGVCAPYFGIIGDADAYQGNAVLTKGEIVTHSVAWLHPYREIRENYESSDVELQTLPRNILDVTVRFGDMDMHAIAVHGAWNREPIDTPENTRQAGILAEYVKKLGNAPFLLGGDLNMPVGSKVIATIDAVAHNAVRGSGMRTTLHPTIHRAAAQHPNGLVVDYIYTSPHFTVEKITAPVIPISDHLPVVGVVCF